MFFLPDIGIMGSDPELFMSILDFHCYLKCLKNSYTLVTQMIVQAGIKVQDGKFLKSNKRAGWNKCTGWKIPQK